MENDKGFPGGIARAVARVFESVLNLFHVQDVAAPAHPCVRGNRASCASKEKVLFFDKKPANETPWTKKLWIYCLRTNMHFALKTDPLKREDLDEFVKCYSAENRHSRRERGV